jgi:hypothetical protein
MDPETDVASQAGPDEGSHAHEESEETTGTDEAVRVWLVERTYSDDELNVVILVYATPDGRRYLRRERALTSFSDRRETPAALEADPGNLGAVEDPDVVEQYRTEVRRVRDRYGPDEPI